MKTKFNLHSIKSRMILCITLLTLLVCAGLSLITLNFANSSFPKTVNSSLLQIVKEGAQVVKAQVDGYYSKMNTLADDSIFQDQVNNKGQIDALLDKKIKEWGYKDIFLSDSSGNVAKYGSDISSQEFFKTALSGKSNISDPLLDTSDKSVNIYIAVPVKNSVGAVNGVLVAKLDGTALSKVTSVITFGKTGAAYMLNSKGTSIAHYNNESVLTLSNIIETAKKDESLAELADLQKKMISGQEGISQYTYKGVVKYVAYCQVGNGTGWSIGMAVAKEEIFADVSGLSRILVIACLVFLILSVVVSLLFAGKISRQLTGAVSLSNLMAKGDFSFTIREATLKRKDELGLLANSFNKINNNLNDILSKINASAQQVYSGSIQISDSSMALSQGATEQASSIEQLSASVEEISAQTNMNANSAKDADQIARDACQKAEMGSVQMDDLLDAMNEINSSSSNISRIIKVIDDIAFQTNILALNAAVEAARAGEHGKGFAVVAEEVRNLAARSASAAKDTTELIEGSVAKVEHGSKIAKDTSTALQSIVSGTKKVADLIKTIAAASSEQASGIDQISQGIAQVSAVVQANSAISEETAASSEELSAQAKMLDEQIEMFKLKGKDSNPAES